MKAGILGSGDVGQALGRGFLGLGWDVRMGSREAHNPKVDAWVAASGPRASGGTFADAAAHGDVIVIATLGVAAEDAIRQAGTGHFKGKAVIDATNPLDLSRGMPPVLAYGTTDSGGERIQRLIPEAKVVKAFNTVGNALMVNPSFPGGTRPDMFIAGNDGGAKEVVSDICRRFGWDVADLGGIEASRALEPMCLAWVLYGVRTGTWAHAFKLLKKPAG